MATVLILSSVGVLGAQNEGQVGPVSPYQPPADAETIEGSIRVDGSSTVWPLIDEAALRFSEQLPGAEVENDISGTGGGFRRLCDGETDFANASRPITFEEERACANAGISYFRFEIAYDGISVVVNPDATFVSCLTTAQLKAIWEPESSIDRWSDLDPAWPDRGIELVGPDPESGTFDYFTEAVVGELGASRTDFLPSMFDLDLVEEVASDENALGYFGYSYYEQNRERLRLLAVDDGQGCTFPSPSSIADGSYLPLSRPLFVYVNAAAVERPEVREFLRFYLAEASDIAAAIGFVPLPASAYSSQQIRLEAIVEGALAPDGPDTTR